MTKRAPRSKSCTICGTSFTPSGDEIFCQRCGGEPDKAKEEKEPEPAKPAAVEEPAIVGSKKILIVDDEPAIVLLLKSRLSKMNYAVVTASNGREGLAVARTEKPNLIITDVLMPEMTGYQLVEHLRDDADIGEIPVIVMSAKHSMKEFFPSWAILTFLAKPFEPEIMMERVVEAIGTSDAAPAASAPQPTQRSSGKTVIVTAVEEFLLEKVKQHLEGNGYRVLNGVNEAGTIQKAKEIRPDMVLAQYWEDTTTLDVGKIYQAFNTDPEMKSIRFATFAADHLGLDAVKVVNPSKVLIYQQSDDLVKLIDEHMQRKA
ncbi:MAG: response regulator [Candidatus Omnitrophota bacterium]|nr:response regulator [Candidatus Omnitrophota bacterium]